LLVKFIKIIVFFQNESKIKIESVEAERCKKKRFTP